MVALRRVDRFLGDPKIWYGEKMADMVVRRSYLYVCVHRRLCSQPAVKSVGAFRPTARSYIRKGDGGNRRWVHADSANKCWMTQGWQHVIPHLMSCQDSIMSSTAATAALCNRSSSTTAAHQPHFLTLQLVEFGDQVERGAYSASWNELFSAPNRLLPVSLALTGTRFLRVAASPRALRSPTSLLS